jgi:hypothetical protein
MKEPFPHDMRAVLSCAGKGLSLKKIFVSTLFLLLGYLLYMVSTYLALLIDGVGLDYIWQSYGMFPLKLFAFDSSMAFAVFFIGIGLALLCVSLAIMACAVINFEELRGDYFFSAYDAVRFTFRRISTLILGYLSLAAFVGFIYLLGVIVGLISRVPFVGDLLVGIFYIVPIFITLVFTVFICFVSVLAVLLLPIIIAAQKEKEVFDALLQLFSIVIKEPVRFIWYLAVTAGLAKVASFVMAYLFYRTAQFSQKVLSTGGGEKIDRQTCWFCHKYFSGNTIWVQLCPMGIRRRRNPCRNNSGNFVFHSIQFHPGIYAIGSVYRSRQGIRGNQADER